VKGFHFHLFLIFSFPIFFGLIPRIPRDENANVDVDVFPGKNTPPSDLNTS